MEINKEREEIILAKILDYTEEVAEKAFDYYVKEKYFILAEKSEIKSGYTIENFKNGEEFGRIFGRQVAIKIKDFIQKL